MPTRHSLAIAVLSVIAAVTASAHGRPAVPADYPSHQQVGSCNQEALARQLQDYNQTRLQVADVLRHLADDKALSHAAKSQLLGYADNLDNMGRHLPLPDPDSSDFQNFDFQLGLTLTAMTLFLNSADEYLTQRFLSERDNPDSTLGLYLARLDDRHQRYTAALANAKSAECRG